MACAAWGHQPGPEPIYAGSMTRIIAGEFGGRRIAVPPKGTRPTSDRVREALFSRLDHEDVLNGARVVDLFAGSGALALEALSRGAAQAVLVESGSPAVRVIQGNAKELGVGARTTVVKSRVQPYLAGLDTAERFTLALLDPPYDIAPTELADVLSALEPHLAPGATVVVEWSSRAPEPTWPRGIEPVVSKRYGETVLHFAAPVR